jgi:hypothetical protein
VAGLKQAGINFVSYIPETRLSEILPVMKADDFFMLAPVASEAEAVGIAAGAALGGKCAAVYMEGTGSLRIDLQPVNGGRAIRRADAAHRRLRRQLRRSTKQLSVFALRNKTKESSTPWESSTLRSNPATAWSSTSTMRFE